MQETRVTELGATMANLQGGGDQERKRGARNEEAGGREEGRS